MLSGSRWYPRRSTSNQPLPPLIDRRSSAYRTTSAVGTSARIAEHVALQRRRHVDRDLAHRFEHVDTDRLDRLAQRA